jgi:hypothetical protein
MATNTSNKSQRSEQAKPPVKKLQDGLLNIAIWGRETDKGTFYSVTHERRYKNKAGDWAGTQSLGEDDLLGMAELMRQAYKEIKLLRSPVRKADAA